MKRLVALFAAPFVLAGALWLLEPHYGPADWWPDSASAQQITTFRQVSSFDRLGTLPPDSLLLVTAPLGTGWVSRAVLATNAFRWYLSTFDWSGLSTTGHRHGEYLTTLDWSGLATTGHGHPEYLTTGRLHAYQYLSTTDVSTRGYLTTVAWTSGGGGITTVDASRTWGSSQQFGHPGSGVATKILHPRSLGAGDWSGQAIVGNVTENVGTSAVLYMTSTGKWALYSARIHTYTLPAGLSQTAITTSSPGVVLLDGAHYCSPHLGLGTSRVNYWASTLAGGVQTLAPGTSNAKVTVWQRVAPDCVRLQFGRYWNLAQ